MSNPDGSNTQSVEKLAERIIKLMDEKDALTEDIKEVFAEVDAAGIDKKALRGAIKVKRECRDLGLEMKINDTLEQIGERKLYSVVEE